MIYVVISFILVLNLHMNKRVFNQTNMLCDAGFSLRRNFHRIKYYERPRVCHNRSLSKATRESGDPFE